jgi:hypothetical protein
MICYDGGLFMTMDAREKAGNAGIWLLDGMGCPVMSSVLCVLKFQARFPIGHYSEKITPLL